MFFSLWKYNNGEGNELVPHVSPRDKSRCVTVPHSASCDGGSSSDRCLGGMSKCEVSHPSPPSPVHLLSLPPLPFSPLVPSSSHSFLPTPFCYMLHSLCSLFVVIGIFTFFLLYFTFTVSYIFSFFPIFLVDILFYYCLSSLPVSPSYTLVIYIVWVLPSPPLF